MREQQQVGRVERHDDDGRRRRRPPSSTRRRRCRRSTAAARARTSPTSARRPTSSRSTPDTLTVVTSLPGPGFWAGSDSDPAKITSGYEYDIAKAMQKEFGLSKLVVRNENFDSITAGTVTNYDVALSQITITCDRAKVVKFSIPYFASNQGILVNKGEPDHDPRRGQDGAVGRADEHHRDRSARQDQARPRTRRSSSRCPTRTPRCRPKQIDAVLIDTAINLGEAAAVERQVRRRPRSSPRPAAPTSTARSCRRTRPTPRRSTRC